MSDHYEALGVARDAPPEIIHAAWLNGSQRCDPVTGTEPDAGRKAVIDAAFDVLRDPVQRARYDASLLAAPPAPEPGAVTGANPDFAPPAPPSPPPPTPPVEAPSGGAPGLAPIGFAGAPGRGGTGSGPAWTPQNRAPASTNPLAIISAVTLCIFPPLALVLAIIARVQINASNGAQRGKGWTTAVIVIVGVMLAILAVGMLSGGFTKVE